MPHRRRFHFARRPRKGLRHDATRPSLALASLCGLVREASTPVLFSKRRAPRVVRRRSGHGDTPCTCFGRHFVAVSRVVSQKKIWEGKTIFLLFPSTSGVRCFLLVTLFHAPATEEAEERVSHPTNGPFHAISRRTRTTTTTYCSPPSTASNPLPPKNNNNNNNFCQTGKERRQPPQQRQQLPWPPAATPTSWRWASTWARRTRAWRCGRATAWRSSPTTRATAPPRLTSPSPTPSGSWATPPKTRRVAELEC